MKYPKPHYKQAGFTLLEILIALTLSSFLMMGIYHVFVSSLQQINTQTALAEVQENARVATWILQHTLRDAGHVGCLSVSPTWQVMQQSATLPYAPKMLSGETVYGYFGEGNRWTPDLPDALQDKVLSNTDVIVIEKSDLNRVQLATAMVSTDAEIQLNRDDVFEADDMLVISDCMSADLFQTSGVQSNSSGQILLHQQPANYSAHLQQAYSALAEVSRWVAQAFYIGETTRKNLQGQPIYALYSQGLLPSAARVEIVSGIANLRLLYGVSTSPSGPAMQWVTADQLSPAWHVVGVSIILLSQSTENVLDTPQSYVWLDETITATDKRLYRVWQTDVALRNLAAD